MRKMLLLILLLTIAIGMGAAVAQTVKVTFLINTSTVPDTLKPNSFVQIRGGTAPLSWDKNSGVLLRNIGGDYWTGEGNFPVNTKIDFKCFTNAVDAQGDREHKGWEQDILPNGNRELMTGTKDTVLPLQFVNGSPDKQLQYWKPFVASDSMDMWFRVNMQGKEDFDAVNQVMGMRGTNNKDWTKTGDIDWGTTLMFKQETQHGNGGSRQYNGENFWSGRVRVPKGVYAAGQEIEFKFVIMKRGDAPDAGPLSWANVQMKAKMPVASEDTTIYWHWWDDKAPSPFKGNDTVEVNYRVDMSRAIQTKGFKLGDTLKVQAGWAGTGRTKLGLSPTNTIMTREGFGNTYTAKESLVIAKNSPVYYQYYLQKSGENIRETFYNFDYKGTDNSLAERRAFVATTNSATVADISTSLTEMRRMPVFRNTTKLTRNVTVTYTCDLRPAYCQVAKGDTLFDIQGNFNVAIKDSVYVWGVWMNGPAAGGWSNDGGDWGNGLRGNLQKKMWDNGTHGDAVSGDHIYTVQFSYGPDSTGSKTFVGQEFKFGCGGGDNEGGRGGFGNNHIENIDDSQPTSTIASQFGSINPRYYNCWDYTKGGPSPVEYSPVPPAVYALDQNYPNPFNPSTHIRYSVPHQSLVTIRVMNALGQQVDMLVNAPHDAGNYMVTFDATKYANGFYYYQMIAGRFVETKKMVLQK